METPVNIASLEYVDLIVIPSSRHHIGRLSPNYLAALHIITNNNKTHFQRFRWISLFIACDPRKINNN